MSSTGVTRTRFRKVLSGAHAGIGLLLLLALWGMVNYLAQRRYLREDWSRQQLTDLSEKTDQVLGGIVQEVEITVMSGKEYKGRDELDDLLREYQDRNSLLKLSWVDPARDIAEAKELNLKYQITEPDQLLMVSGERHVVLPLEEFLVYEEDEDRPMGQAPKVIGFQGETYISSALLQLSPQERPVLYFLTGHGEQDIENFEQVQGAYSNIRERLELDNIDVRPLNLEESRGVPADAAAIVIAGPRSRISQPELDLLRRYLERNGRMMVLVDMLQDAGLAPLLEDWGIRLLRDMVVDPSRTLRGADVHVTEYGVHPVTRSLGKIRSIFLRPRSILPLAPPDPTKDEPRYTALASSTDQGWAELDLQAEPIQFNANVDQRGPIPVAAAIEWAVPGVEDPLSSESRLVVVGDSEFAGNLLRNGGGMLFFQNSVNWLLDRSELLAIPQKTVDEIRLEMDQPALNRLFTQLVLLLPGAAMLLGALVAWRRRS